MISIELIRSSPDVVKNAGRRRGVDISIASILGLDHERRSAIVAGDALKAQRNEVNRRLAREKERRVEVIDEMRLIGSRIKEIDETILQLTSKLNGMLRDIPNLPDQSVPDGETDSDNVEIKVSGEKPAFDFEPKPHWELGEKLEIIDLYRGAKLAGSRFYVLNGKGAKLQRALTQWMLDLHTEQHGYREVYVPYLASAETVLSSGHLPHFKEEMYRDNEDDLWMIPTAEVPVTNLHREEIIDVGSLPLYYVAHTPCWRREKFSAGRDTRGIKRVHQFEKVEMYKFVEPEKSPQELEGLVADAEDVCVGLGIAYRIIELCSGDLGFAPAKSYDLEMWSPAEDQWLEVSSCSNCTDFQARRASIRYRPKSGARPRLVHTLNGSGLAIPRVLIAILENYQQRDGSVRVPEVLLPYTGFDRIEGP